MKKPEKQLIIRNRYDVELPLTSDSLRNVMYYAVCSPVKYNEVAYHDSLDKLSLITDTVLDILQNEETTVFIERDLRYAIAYALDHITPSNAGIYPTPSDINLAIYMVYA